MTTRNAILIPPSLGELLAADAQEDIAVDNADGTLEFKLWFTRDRHASIVAVEFLLVSVDWWGAVNSVRRGFSQDLGEHPRTGLQWRWPSKRAFLHQRGLAVATRVALASRLEYQPVVATDEEITSVLGIDLFATPGDYERLRVLAQ